MRTYAQKCRANPIAQVIGGTSLLCLLVCAGCTSRTERAVFDFPCGQARLQMVERVVKTFETTHRGYELVLQEADRTRTVWLSPDGTLSMVEQTLTTTEAHAPSSSRRATSSPGCTHIWNRGA